MSFFQQTKQRQMDSAAQRQKESEKRNGERPSGGEKVKLKDNVVLSRFESFFPVLRWLGYKMASAMPDPNENMINFILL